MLRLSAPVLSLLVALLAPGLALAATPNRAQLTGEVIDPWCYLSEIMYAEGTAHHQCAIWCAAGGMPVALLTEDGQVYFIVGFAGRATTLADTHLLEITTHRITLAGSVYERDSRKYLVVSAVMER